jgi:hypothetical protein
MARSLMDPSHVGGTIGMRDEVAKSRRPHQRIRQRTLDHAGLLQKSKDIAGARGCTEFERKAGSHPAPWDHSPQPQTWPRFCVLSQPISGAKYSMMAEASMRRVPVSFSSVSCQGRLAPAASIA